MRKQIQKIENFKLAVAYERPSPPVPLFSLSGVRLRRQIQKQ
jgi:hypothetical protein